MIALILIAPYLFAAEIEAIHVDGTVQSDKTDRYFTSQSYTSEKNPADVEISETLRRLPGVHVRAQSGMGSLTTATLPGALNAASSAVSIDSIPVPDPVALGVNQSLFPVSFIQGIEFQSPFYSGIDSKSVLIPTQGGRLNILTQSKTIGGSEKGIGAHASLGTANTGLGAVSYRGADSNKDYLVGVQGFSTRGDHPFINPETKARARRENNDAAAGAVILKYRRRVFRDSVFQFLQMNSRIDRTNPGSLSFPGRDHERDTFNLTGLSLDHESYFAKGALTISRVQNEISESNRTDSHTTGGYAQAGRTGLISSKVRATVAVDELNEKSNDGSGVFSRNTNGLSTLFNADLGAFELSPHLRYEYNTQYQHGFNATLTAEKNFSDSLAASLSHGYLTQYPAIIASQGYYAGTLSVLRNQDLLPEHTSMTQAGVAFTGEVSGKKIKIQSQTFHSLIRNRAVYTSLSFTQAQYRNVPLATLIGETISLEIEASNNLKVRENISLARAWDRSSAHEFPYKPRFQSNTAFEFEIYKNARTSFTLTAEEDLMSKRVINLTDEQSLSPTAVTSVRADANFADAGSFFVKVSNVFDEAGYSTSGYPIFSREYVLGYRL